MLYFNRLNGSERHGEERVHTFVRNASETTEFSFSVMGKKYCSLISESSEIFWLEVMDPETTQGMGPSSSSRLSDQTVSGTTSEEWACED